MNFIDLSVLVNKNTPAYPGDPKVKIRPLGVFAKDGYNDHLITMANHVGTHIDAPRHMVKDGKTLDRIPLDQFVGRGVLIQLKNKKFDLQTLKKVSIKKGDIVLFYSGMDKQYHQKSYFDSRPEMPEEIAAYLVDKKIKIVGLDMLSPDKEPFRAHRILLGSGVLIIENLINLGKLVDKKFSVYALPIKFQLDGAPARVVAEINE